MKHLAEMPKSPLPPSLTAVQRRQHWVPAPRRRRSTRQRTGPSTGRRKLLQNAGKLGHQRDSENSERSWWILLPCGYNLLRVVLALGPRQKRTDKQIKQGWLRRRTGQTHQTWRTSKNMENSMICSVKLLSTRWKQWWGTAQTNEKIAAPKRSSDEKCNELRWLPQDGVNRRANEETDKQLPVETISSIQTRKLQTDPTHWA